MRTRTWWIIGWLALGLASCSAGSLTATEYAETVEDLVAEMEGRFAEADADWEAEAPSLAGALRYWDIRLEIREDFLEDVRALEPPPEVEAMHADALEVFRRITEADVALAARVTQYSEVTTHRQWLETPEGNASLAVLEDVYAFCRASQEDFDATRSRESLEDAPWLPTEMREVIKVAFGCPPQP